MTHYLIGNKITNNKVMHFGLLMCLAVFLAIALKTPSAVFAAPGTCSCCVIDEATGHEACGPWDSGACVGVNNCNKAEKYVPKCNPVTEDIDANPPIFCGGCTCEYDASYVPPPAAPGIKAFSLCDSTGTFKEECLKCMDPARTSNPGSWTALGCIPTGTPATFINSFLGFGIGIAGGIAFLLILIGGFQMMTSSGNPEKLNAGKELVGAAITGLILIIFSVFVLKLIGVDILGIPNFK